MAINQGFFMSIFIASQLTNKMAEYQMRFGILIKFDASKRYAPQSQFTLHELHILGFLRFLMCICFMFHDKSHFKYIFQFMGLNKLYKNLYNGDCFGISHIKAKSTSRTKIS